MTNSGTQQRTKLPEKAPVRNAARSLSNWPTKGSQQCEKTTRKQAVTRNRSTQPMRSRAGAFGLGSRFSICLSGLIGFLRRYEKKARRHDFFSQRCTVFCAGTCGFLCPAVLFGAGIHRLARHCVLVRAFGFCLPALSSELLPAAACASAITSQPLSSSPFVPALTPPLASEPLSPGCPCAGTCGSPRPVPPAGQFTTTVGKYSRKSAAARSDCSGVFSCTPASLYSLPIASYL